LHHSGESTNPLCRSGCRWPRNGFHRDEDFYEAIKGLQPETGRVAKTGSFAKKMIAIMTIGVFFLLLVLAYPTVCIMITLVGTLKKRTARKLFQDTASIEAIDQATDRLKKSAFIISIGVSFFILAPFIALMVIADLF
jgi:hypothetical protein